MCDQVHVLKEMKDYWGEMLGLGATSFWEKYDPSEKGAQHTAMYGRLQWMEGEIPTPHGNIQVYCSRTRIRVKAATGMGILRFMSKSLPLCKEGVVLSTGKGLYEIKVEKEKEYLV